MDDTITNKQNIFYEKNLKLFATCNKQYTGPYTFAKGAILVKTKFWENLNVVEDFVNKTNNYSKNVDN